MEDKLKDLMNIAEDGIHAIDNQVRDLEYNITKLEDQNEDETTSVQLPPVHTSLVISLLSDIHWHALTLMLAWVDGCSSVWLRCSCSCSAVSICAGQGVYNM